MDAQLLTDNERKLLRSKIYRDAGYTKAPDYSTRFAESVTKNWQESPLYTLLERTEFQHLALNRTSNGKVEFHQRRHHRKKELTERKLPPTLVDSEQNRVVFIQLCRSVADTCGRLPDDCVMTAFCTSLGYTENLWNTTRRAMKDQGYTFTPVENGYIVDHADKIRINQIKQEMERLQSELQSLTKKSPAKS